MSEFWIIMSGAGNLRIPVWLTNYPGDRNSDTWTHDPLWQESRKF